MKKAKSYNIIAKMYAFIMFLFLNRKFDIVKLLFLAGLIFTSIFVLAVAEPGDREKIPTAVEYERPSIIYGTNANGDYEPIAEFYKFSRVPVSIAKLKTPKEENKTIQCFLSTEDVSFYSHFGIDIRGILRAIAVNIIAGKIKEGASTITQQVARLKFLTIERSYSRKLREAWMAVLMESYFSKDAILEMYLNEIPLGHGTLGVGAAARFYFRKSLEELSWGESALLSSLTTRPKDFSPIVNPGISSKKVRVVFMKLIESGRMNIKTAQEEYDKFTEYYRKLNRSPNDSAFSDRLNRFPYFTEYIRRQLESNKDLKKDIYTGGYKIYTTLNVHHQKSAEEVFYPSLTLQTKTSSVGKLVDVEIFDRTYGDAYDVISHIYGLPPFKVKNYRGQKKFLSEFHESMRNNLAVLNLVTGSANVGEAIDEDYNRGDTEDHTMQVEGGLISMRPDTGHITALVGGSGFRSDNQKIRPIQALRQPGSAFKPLVYAAAIDYYGKNPSPNPDENVTPSSLFLDSPMNYLMEDGDEWTPGNYSDNYGGFMRLRSALETSRNMVALRVLDQTGLSKIYPKLVEILPTGRDIPKNISIALGTYEVTPLELTKAYSIFVTGGKEVHPISILYITDMKDKMIKDYREEHEKLERKQIISPEASYIMVSMLRSVVKKGTGKAAMDYGLKRKAAGKTGTTNNFRDAWFIGFTPELITTVWMGYDLGTLSLGKGMAGGVIATPIWGKYMAKALENEPIKKYGFPKGMNISKKEVCTLSGKQKGPRCTSTYKEMFITGTEPDICDFHRGVIPSFTPMDKEKEKEDSHKSLNKDASNPAKKTEESPVKKTEENPPKKEEQAPSKNDTPPKDIFKNDEKLE